MDEKTEQLRDIFMDVTDDKSVTESQSAGHGSLAGVDEAAVDEQLRGVITRMRKRYGFDTDLGDDALVTVVRGFYTGREDDDLAAELDTTPAAVAAARLDLHLARDDDIGDDVDAAFRRAVVEADSETVSDDALAGRFSLDGERVSWYRRVVESQAAARRVSHRFTSEFEDALTEAGLSTQLTAAVRESGLEEATEDIDSLDSDADVSM